MTIARDARCDICEVTRSLMTMKRDKGGVGGWDPAECGTMVNKDEAFESGGGKKRQTQDF